MLLDMTKMPLDDLSALGQLLLSLLLRQAFSHRLHRCGMRPNLNNPPPFAVLA
jgi:hypothetical protein